MDTPANLDELVSAVERLDQAGYRLVECAVTEGERIELRVVAEPLSR